MTRSGPLQQRRAWAVICLVVVGAGIAAGLLFEALRVQARGERALFDEANRLVARTRELDAILSAADLYPSATLPPTFAPGVAERVRAARDTATSDAERSWLERAAVCLAEGACTAPWREWLRNAKAEHAPALRIAMDDAARARAHATALVASAIALHAALLMAAAAGAWHLARQHHGDAADALAPAPSDPPGEQREAHLRARLEELYALRLRALESDRFAAYGEIAAGLSHGLKTPLASIRAAAEVALLKVGGQHAAATHLEDAIEEVDNLIEQVKRFLQASGAGGAKPVRVHLGDLANALAASYQDGAAAQDVRVIVNVQNAPQTVADPSLLEMALRNVIENALAASPAGSTVTLHARPCEAPLRVGIDQAAPAQTAFVEIGVLDEGAGAPDVLLAQAPRGSGKAHGSGLGVAIARRIAARHGGSLDIERCEPRGTFVHLRLPSAHGDAP